MLLKFVFPSVLYFNNKYLLRVCFIVSIVSIVAVLLKACLTMDSHKEAFSVLTLIRFLCFGFCLFACLFWFAFSPAMEGEKQMLLKISLL